MKVVITTLLVLILCGRTHSQELDSFKFQTHIINPFENNWIKSNTIQISAEKKAQMLYDGIMNTDSMTIGAAFFPYNIKTGQEKNWIEFAEQHTRAVDVNGDGYLDILFSLFDEEDYSTRPFYCYLSSEEGMIDGFQASHVTHLEIKNNKLEKLQTYHGKCCTYWFAIFSDIVLREDNAYKGMTYFIEGSPPKLLKALNDGTITKDEKLNAQSSEGSGQGMEWVRAGIEISVYAEQDGFSFIACPKGDVKNGWILAWVKSSSIKYD